MATEPLISWNAPEHIHFEKTNDWYWGVGIVTLTLTVIAFLFGSIITGLLILIGSTALVIHASKPARTIYYEINDRGLMIDDVLYPFLSLESFWVTHDQVFPKLLIKSRRPLMPLIAIHIDEINPEEIRNVLLRYIAETEHREHFLKQTLESFGF
jgi:hypothetical protein